MIKYFITGLIIYGIYKYFIATPKSPLNKAEETKSFNPSKEEPPKKAKGEYIDYEEID